MTTHTLSDGTKVPDHYDFNQHFEPLTVKMQGQQGICWYETRCTMLEAFWRMYTDKAPTFDPHALAHSDDDWSVSHWTDERFDPPHPLGTLTYLGGDKLINLDGYKDMPHKDAIIKALWTNGVIEGGTCAEQSMDRLYQKPWKYAGYNRDKERFSHLPVLTTMPGDLAALQRGNWAHAVIYVGYDWDLGILFQNSWSARFGKYGRAYFGWDMVEKEVADAGFIHAFNDNPANSFKMPPVRS